MRPASFTTFNLVSWALRWVAHTGSAGCCEPRQFQQSAPHSRVQVGSVARLRTRHAQTWPVEAKPSPAIFMKELGSLAAHLRAVDPEFHAEEINRLTGVSDAS